MQVVYQDGKNGGNCSAGKKLSEEQNVPVLAKTGKRVRVLGYNAY